MNAQIQSPQPIPEYSGRRVSDKALADSKKEILGIGPGRLHHPRIVAVFEFHLMKYQFHGNLRLVSSLYEGASTLCERGASILLCFLFCSRKSGLGLAHMLAKPPGG